MSRLIRADKNLVGVAVGEGLSNKSALGSTIFGGRDITITKREIGLVEFFYQVCGNEKGTREGGENI